MATERSRLSLPAFYALAGGGWRDLVTLLHAPYTAWNLGYVALGAAAASTVHSGRLLATLGAFFLAVGVSAHALDELNGRPLQTSLRRGTLIALAAVGLAGAVAIGVAGAAVVSPVLAPLVVLGALLVLAYNLELAGGRFHTDAWFALAWGGFPAFTGYFAQTLTIRPAGLLVAAGCCLLSAAQRRLSTPVRELRRRTVAVSGQQRLSDGTAVELTKARLAAPLEGALAALSFAVVLLAAGLIAGKL
ncbi:MAG TPA: hypothetical protein VG388_13175 [Solirubrobacteraceae bacterium]|jgi:hypothetical protein|nr:hypothetical protein [Solirubrobacteraceae bacterium]